MFTADIACLAPEARVVCHVATDNYSGGKQAAAAMIEAIGAKGTIAIRGAGKGRQSRTDGVRAEYQVAYRQRAN